MVIEYLRRETGDVVVSQRPCSVTKLTRKTVNVWMGGLKRLSLQLVCACTDDMTQTILGKIARSVINWRKRSTCRSTHDGRTCWASAYTTLDVNCMPKYGKQGIGVPRNLQWMGLIWVYPRIFQGEPRQGPADEFSQRLKQNVKLV